MKVDSSKVVPLEQIPEMDDEQRDWLKRKCGLHKGYFEPSTEKFVVSRRG